MAAVRTDENQAVAGDLDRGARLPLIAIVAVHGVADQKPFDSARQISDLLLQCRHGGGEATYSSFREYPVRIPVDHAIHTRADPATDAPLDVKFTNELLANYQSDRTAYDTVRLEGHRLREPRQGESDTWIHRDQCHVHVYEMYWADLSRLGTGLVGIAGALYQLISSLAELGLRTIRQVQPSTRDGVSQGVWRWYLGAHAMAVFCLTLLVPFFNLALLAIALAVPIAATPPRLLAWSLGALFLVGGIGTAMFIWLQRGKRERWRVKLSKLVAILAFVLSALVVWALLGPLSAWTLNAGLFAWAVVAGFGILSIARAYSSRSAEVRWVGRPIAMVTGGLLAVLALSSQSRIAAADSAVRLIEGLFYFLSASWFGVLLGGALSGFFALMAVRRRRLVRQAAWTAGTTLALSTASVSALAMLVWSAAFALTERSLPRSFTDDSTRVARVNEERDAAAGVGMVATSDSSFAYHALIPHLVIDSATSRHCFDGVGEAVWRPGANRTPRMCREFSQRSMPRYLMSLSSATGLLLSVATLALLAFVGLILATPAVIRELWPRHDTAKARARSAPLGTFLTAGFNLFRRVTVGAYGLLFVGTLVVIGLGFWLRSNPDGAVLARGVLRFLRPIADGMLFSAFGSIAGSAVAASTLGVVVLLSRFESVARVVRPVLDVVLDVDNYLKDRPRKKTPRARIAERFVSLLRYLTHWRREGKGYDRVIVVSHSQGAVIAAEILRYHKNAAFRDLPPLTDVASPRRPGASRMPPVDLVTMGSPLRQLYGRSFPDLFAWTAGRSAVPDDLLGANATHGQRHPGPSCRDVGVHSWTNLYRSGDYVGRSLWQGDDAESTYAVAAGDGRWHKPEHDDACRERCLGEGAHTHYWDVNAADVAQELDDLIVHALGERR